MIMLLEGSVPKVYKYVFANELFYTLHKSVGKLHIIISSIINFNKGLKQEKIKGELETKELGGKWCKGAKTGKGETSTVWGGGQRGLTPPIPPSLILQTRSKLF